MAQRNDLAEKKKLLFDGVEVPGLVSVSELPMEKGIIDVPEFSRIRKIQNGISTVPEIQMVFKIQRDTAALQFFRDYYYNDLTHDITVIRCDASGAEFDRTLLVSCECVKITDPEFDAANPTFAKVTATIVPYDVKPVAA
jgi:hypothetical protein